MHFYLKFLCSNFSMWRNPPYNCFLNNFKYCCLLDGPACTATCWKPDKTLCSNLCAAPSSKLVSHVSYSWTQTSISNKDLLFCSVSESWPDSCSLYSFFPFHLPTFLFYPFIPHKYFHQHLFVSCGCWFISPSPVHGSVQQSLNKWFEVAGTNFTWKKEQ